ncbi:hypothetical protein [Streptomyces sp. WAC 04229]|uniref:hypothetical protein n=1 Tax=Streptomyces sp. WAC 04229 TaxID=2203206 RepID=UPI003D73C4D3
MAAGIEAWVAGDDRHRVFAAVQQRASLLAAEELKRLEHRTSLTPTERAEVATVLRRLTSRLVLVPLSTWQGDPGLAAELFGLPQSPSSKGYPS